jgi:hypothetical protein
MTLPDDQKLTDHGLAPKGDAARTLVIACGALAREILDIKALNGWWHLDLTCLPAKLHNHPDQIPDAVEAAVMAHRAQYDRIMIAYGDCGTGGRLAALCARLGVTMIDAPHCYAFFEGVRRFADHDDEITAFYLTDFLVRQFDAFVWHPLGLDRFPDLRDMYFGNYTKLVYLSQTDDPRLDALAQASADRLGLAYERRPTGYGDLSVWLGTAARSDTGPPTPVR